MVIDARTYIVPTRLVWPGFFLSVLLSGIAAAAGSQPRWLLGGLIGVGVLAGPLFLLWVVMPAGMGFGDVRLAVLLGWTVGFVMADHRPVSSVFAALVCLVVAAVLGLVFGMLVIGARGMRAKVPFGPTLVAAALLVCGLAPHLRHAFKV
jgi:leader peptidase (prepilin peptidase)/N-methyltransferase